MEMYAMVGEFTASGLATAVERDNGEVKGKALHIRDDGTPAHARRGISAGAFREGFAPLEVEPGAWIYIKPDGENASHETFALAGEFFDGRARVCNVPRKEYHIGLDMKPAYAERFFWVSPFENGQALVSDHDQTAVKIDRDGKRLPKAK